MSNGDPQGEVTFSTGALQDAVEAMAWYETRSEEAANLYERELRQRFRRLLRFPESSRPLSRGSPVRLSVLRRFHTLRLRRRRRPGHKWSAPPRLHLRTRGLLRPARLAPGEVYLDPHDAWDAACEARSGEDGLLVTGSLYLISYLRPRLVSAFGGK